MREKTTSLLRPAPQSTSFSRGLRYRGTRAVRLFSFRPSFSDVLETEAPEGDRGAPGAAHHLLVPDLGAASPRGWGVTPSGGSSPGGGAPRGVGRSLCAALRGSANASARDCAHGSALCARLCAEDAGDDFVGGVHI